MLNEIYQRLATADRRFQQRLGARFILRASVGFLGLLLVGFALDVILHLEAASRLAFMGGFVFLSLAVAGVALWIAQFRNSKPEQVARMLESRDATLGSKLINLLQLRAQIDEGKQPPVTRALAEQAVDDYAQQLQGRDFTPLTHSPELRLTARRVGIGFLAVGGLLALMWPISTVEFLRFIDPFGDHPPYSFTQIAFVEPDDGVEVAYNANALFKARTEGHRPKDLFLSFYDPAQPEKIRTLPMFDKGDAGFFQAIESVRSDLLVYAHTKNEKSLSKKRRVNVGLTPKIEHAFIEIAPPAYTGLPKNERPFEFKNITALHGSKVRFRIQSNRPLAGGTVTPAVGNPVSMLPTVENEAEGTLLATESTRLQFALLDIAGNRSHEVPSAPLTVTTDQPPDVRIDSPGEDGFVCDDFKVEVRISAGDDYGISKVRLHRALNDVFSGPKSFSYDTIVRTAAEMVTLDIAKLGVTPGDTISLFAEAIDTAPEPHLARSKTLRLMVISTPEYNDMIRERVDIGNIHDKYAALLNQFHDLVQEQRELEERARKLQEDSTLNEKDRFKKLEQEMAAQAELNQKLGKLADTMENFVRKEPIYDVETELQETLKARANEMRSSVETNHQQLQKQMEKMADGATQAEQKEALASLQKEAKEQHERLEPTRQQAAEEILEPLKESALMHALLNDFNAVKAIAEMQAVTAGEAKAYENHRAPSNEDKLALRQLASTEKQVEKALAQVAKNLRKHAGEAEVEFPKAAKSAMDLADALEDRRLSPMAGETALAMISGKGPESAALAERLQKELERFFEDDPAGAGGAMCRELDQRLRLRNRNPGKTFEQMAKSRKFGLGRGHGMGQGSPGGSGEMGDDGYSVSSGANFGLFGNESLGGESNKAGAGNAGLGGESPGGKKVELDKADGTSDVPSVNRASGEVRSELPIDEYRNVIDAYFESLTR